MQETTPPLRPLDANGHLRHVGDWDPVWAERVAYEEGLALTPAHWEVLGFLRDYYARYQLTPPMRLSVQALAAQCGRPDMNSRTLYRLFPQGISKQACRYAGLPRPSICI